MINEQKNNKLDETIKQSLSDYEAPFDPNDWAKMESTLDLTPKTNTFSWSYVIGVFVILAIGTGGYLLYNKWSTFKTNIPETTQPTVKTPVPVVKKAPAIVTPTVTKPTPLPETKTETPVIIDETVNNTKEKEIGSNSKTSKIEPAPTEKTKKKKTKEEISKDKEGENSKHQQVIIMGNEPIFGDMLDSTRGLQ